MTPLLWRRLAYLRRLDKTAADKQPAESAESSEERPSTARKITSLGLRGLGGVATGTGIGLGGAQLAGRFLGQSAPSWLRTFSDRMVISPQRLIGIPVDQPLRQVWRLMAMNALRRYGIAASLLGGGLGTYALGHYLRPKDQSANNPAG